MSDEKIINYATGDINFSSIELQQFESFINKNKPEFKDLNLIKKSKPLTENELIRKNELKEQITTLSIELNLPT